MPLIETPAAEGLARVTVRLERPPFDMVTDWEAVLPTGTEPNFTDEGASEIVPDGFVVWLLLPLLGVKPMQPELDTIARIKTNKSAVEINLLAMGNACPRFLSCSRTSHS